MSQSRSLTPLSGSISRRSFLARGSLGAVGYALASDVLPVCSTIHCPVTVKRQVTECRTVCGGIAAMGDLVTVRHSVPLLNLDINEFERPLGLVTGTADRLEQQFQGGDQF